MMIDGIVQDVRVAVRTLARNRGFTFVVVLTLALGIGANTAVFGIVNNILLRPLPFPDEDRVVRVRNSGVMPNGNAYEFNLPGADYSILREHNRSFSGMVALQFGSGILLGHGDPERVAVIGVNGAWEDVLGIGPIAGRFFTAEEISAGRGSGVAVLSWGLWQQRFGGTNILGQELRIEDQSYTIVGVLPRGFRFPYEADLWVPARESELMGSAVFARLRPAIDLTQAQAEMDALGQRIKTQNNYRISEFGVKLRRARASLIENEDQIALSLLGVVGTFLLIACINVASLLLARSVARQRELAIRIALGANRVRRIRQVMTESVLLALLGAVAGLSVVVWAGPYLELLVPSNFSEELGIGKVEINPNVLLFALGCALLTALLCGLMPAWRSGHNDVQFALRANVRSSAGHKQRRLLSGLVVAEVAVALAMLSGAALMVQHLVRISSRPLGFDAANVLTMQVTYPSAYTDPERRTQLIQQLQQQVSSVPGVRTAAISTMNPLTGGTWGAPVIAAEGKMAAEDAAVLVNHRLVTPAMFSTLQIPILRGRDFTDRDRAGSEPVVIVSRELAERLWPGDEPLGKRLRLGRPGTRWMSVVGVVGDVRDNGEIRGTWYLPYGQNAETPAAVRVNLMVRSTGSIDAIAGAVQSAIHAVDRALAAHEVASMESIHAETYAQDRLGAFLATGLALFGLLLAVVGIYGVVSFGVQQRFHEIGIRMAVGASGAQVLRMVLGGGMRLVLTGLGIGIFAAYGIALIMASFVPDLPTQDLRSLSLAMLILAGGALIASYLPARRATKVDPMVALRYE